VRGEGAEGLKAHGRETFLWPAGCAAMSKYHMVW